MSGRGVADGYLRESKEDLAQGYSPDEMIRQIKAKIVASGYEVGAIVVEVAKRDEYDPPLLMAELEKARRGEIQALASWDMFRFSGELGKHLYLRDEFAATGTELLFATVEFPDTDEGRLQEIVMGGIGGWERAKIRTRTQNGIKAKLARGHFVCNGQAPYGTEKVYDDRQRPIGYRPGAHFPILERIIREAAVRPFADICADLTREGIPTPAGKGRWVPGMVSALLANTTYEGLYRFRATKRTRSGRGPNGKLRYTAERRPASEVDTIRAEPLVDPDALAAARSAAARRVSDRRPRWGDGEDAFPLRGLLTCADCGGVLSVRPSKGYRWYVCGRAYPRKADLAKPGFRRCTLPHLRADEIERHVWAELGAALADEARLEAALLQAADGGEQRRRYDDQVASLAASIERQERRIDNATDTMTDAGRGTRAYERALDTLHAAETALAELERNRAALERQAPRVVTAAECDELRGLFRAARRQIERAASSPPKQRLAYRALGVRATIGLAGGDAGVKLGRDHRWTVGLEGAVAFTSSGKAPHGSLSLWGSPADPLALLLRPVA